MKLIPIKHAKVYVAVMVAISQQVMAAETAPEESVVVWGTSVASNSEYLGDQDMSLKQAIKNITKDWEKLYSEQKASYEHSISGIKNPMVVVAISDKSEDYSVDIEAIGISPQGNIFWAYASGCSCWDGDYTEETKPTIKEFQLVHEHTPEEWQAMMRIVE